MYPFIEFSSFKISVYFITLAIVYCIGIQYFFARIKKFPLRVYLAADFLLVLLVSGFLGARLFYVFYQEPEFYLKNLKQIIAVWNGGFVFYGGFLAALFFGILFLKFKRQNVRMWLDLSAPVAAFCYGLGRLACLFNGCCYGKITTSAWGISFPHLHGLRHPTQLYAVFYELLVWVGLLILERRSPFIRSNRGSLFAIWLGLHGVGRLIMEHFRSDPRGHLIYGYTVSTVISFSLILLSIILLITFTNGMKSRHR